ncbi:MAG: cohesin domain-containing protein [Bacilli bacterium]|nr:cohesin domain-containing protein [Bacilli bacterium]
MKKIIILIIMLLSIILPTTVNAASGSIKATVTSSRVTLNNIVTVTVKVSSDKPIGSWQFNIEYDSSKLNIQSGNPIVVDYGNGSYNSKTYTYKFKAVGLGSTTVKVVNAKIADYETVSYINTTTSGVTLNVSEPVSIKYSSDNNLSSLSVDEFNITPEFDKNTLEYSVLLSPGVEKIKIDAKTSHNKAKVSGLGEINVVEGENLLPVTVTAENGASKTYTIRATVPEREPLKVNDGYSIFRKMPEERPLYFNEKQIKINDEEIIVLYNKKLSLTLVYASNNDDNTGFYEWSNNRVLREFISINNEDLSIRILPEIGKEASRNLKGLIKSEIIIKENSIKAYQITKKSKYYIISGTDLITGQTNLYNYDSKNKTLQIYDQESINYLLDQIIEKKIIIYALSGSLVIFIIITILLSRNKNKLQKLEKKIKNSKDEESKN